ncbi:GTP cyclohydrolase I FolE [Anaerocolumna sp. MB42-C2]|uniref:GTP cyclohydrolase I FolE n=1 Tax=Anaerocolumna sp. MB42-C2 TaxID=3070997 RepID=UPI0027E0D12F|nr:GTP cyclohydrolase I FolE [Anaerocolumna sp. MB42-C2]WMJ87623.1 GTP cyclohydrolase I FolE [Anaerocolumna sp. MB42-C2]
MDDKKIEEAVKLFLEGIGEDVHREGLSDTPKRIAAMCKEIFGGLNQETDKFLSKTFSAVNNEIILEKDITFYSVCEHHLLPFYGKAHIGYIPDGKVLGLSKLARTVETYARRPQIQEQLTAQIADDIMKYLKPKGVIVLLEAEHMCMTMRGVKKPGTLTTTLLGRGVFEDNTELRNTFFQLLK